MSETRSPSTLYFYQSSDGPAYCSGSLNRHISTSLFVLHKRKKERGETELIFVTGYLSISRSKEEWLECTELLGLKEPGYRYRSRGSGDEAVVVVSYRENLTSKV